MSPQPNRDREFEIVEIRYRSTDPNNFKGIKGYGCEVVSGGFGGSANLLVFETEGEEGQVFQNTMQAYNGNRIGGITFDRIRLVPGQNNATEVVTLKVMTGRRSMFADAPQSFFPDRICLTESDSAGAFYRGGTHTEYGILATTAGTIFDSRAALVSGFEDNLVNRPGRSNPGRYNYLDGYIASDTDGDWSVWVQVTDYPDEANFAAGKWTTIGAWKPLDYTDANVTVPAGINDGGDDYTGGALWFGTHNQTSENYFGAGNGAMNGLIPTARGLKIWIANESLSAQNFVWKIGLRTGP